MRKDNEQVCPAKLDVTFTHLIGPPSALHVFQVCTKILAAAQYIRGAALGHVCRRMYVGVLPSCPADDTSCYLIGHVLMAGLTTHLSALLNPETKVVHEYQVAVYDKRLIYSPYSARDDRYFKSVGWPTPSSRSSCAPPCSTASCIRAIQDHIVMSTTGQGRGGTGT